MLNLEDSLASYNQVDNNKFKTIVVFDCRGMEPVEFSPRNGWKVVSKIIIYLKLKIFNCSHIDMLNVHNFPP